jgi:tetratricopeptide (TPR) repeat protein
MSGKMNYHVGIEEGKYMGDNWVKAAGERGIPQAFIIDQQGRVAWIGQPKFLDTALPRVLAGNWDIAAAGADRKETQRLTLLDQAVIPRLNPFMGNPGRPDSALMEIKKILDQDPELKYYPHTGHFTFYSLLKTDPERALVFGKEWVAANAIPEWRDITEAISYMTDVRKKDLPRGLYELSAASYQAQIDNYPWSMDMPAIYDNIAALQMRAGNKNKAIEAELKAIDNAKARPGYSQDELEKLKANLERYKSDSRSS